MTHPIFLVRHGQTEWNMAGRLQGSLDSPLTERGIQQAEAMGYLLKKHIANGSWRLIASPLGRTRRTAQIIGRICNLQPVFDARLQEVFMGQWEGITFGEFEQLAARADPAANSFQRFFCSPDGETYEAISARAANVLRDITQPTILVSHGIFGRLLRGLYLGLDPAQIPDLPSASQEGVFDLRNGAINFIPIQQPAII